MIPYMMDTSGAFGGYINHTEEKNQIIKAVGEGRAIPNVSDHYTSREVEQMEDIVWSKYRVKADLSFLL